MTELNLDKMNLKSIPECISKLKKLENLSLNCNNITCIPEWIGELKELKI